MSIFGSAHATNPGDYAIYSGSNLQQFWDESAGSWQIYTGTGAKTLALTIDTNQISTFVSYAIMPAATTSIPSIRLPHGTAPSSPTNGDMWTTTAGLYVQINGSTVGPLS